MNRKWTEEEAWAWYREQKWIRGFCGYPSNCVNRIAMWQEYKHKEVFDEIEREFKLAKETGFNAVRTVLQFDVWLYQHDSFMKHLDEYFDLADRYGLKIMLVPTGDCSVAKSRWKPPVFGEQNIDWGYHSGIKGGQHAGDYTEPGYILQDDPALLPRYYEMVDELAAKYGKDPRLQIWNVWNEVGNSNRLWMSVPMVRRSVEIIRSHDPIQPLTIECWERYLPADSPLWDIQREMLELSDIISFHNYSPFPEMVKAIDELKPYNRPILNTEWLNRIEKNNVDEIFPLFYLENIGNYCWGLIQGFSQTYEPWGRYFKDIADPNYHGDLDFTKLQHDLYRFNGLPYIAKEIEIIKEFSARADEKWEREHRK